MKKSLILIAIAISSVVFPACERQDWSETKMFHDVPKRKIDEKSAATEGAAKPEAAKHAEK